MWNVAHCPPLLKNMGNRTSPYSIITLIKKYICICICIFIKKDLEEIWQKYGGVYLGIGFKDELIFYLMPFCN
jgi:hypothetical protein